MASPGEGLAFLQAHVDFDGEGCLIWPFSRVGGGYGGLQYEGRKIIASRLMCRLAHGEPPSPDYEAAHSCGKGHEGCVHPGHLRWATVAVNHHDKVEHGTVLRGTRNPTSKLTPEQVRQIRSRVESGEGVKSLARAFGIHHRSVGRIVRGIHWSWLP